MNPFAVPTPPAPDLGELVPLGHVIIKLDVSAQTTMPDTPNGYTAVPKVMADQGDLDTSALDGDAGPPGQIGFQVREAVDPTINSEADLKPLPNSPEYIGRYFLLENLDPNTGQVVGQTAYVWYGTSYRRVMMGTFGPPGPVPDITPLVELIPPYDANNNPNPSYVEPSGPRLDPTWEFFVAAPAGSSGQVTPIYDFPDVDEVTAAPVNGDLMSFTGKYTKNGQGIWAPAGIGALLPKTWSMPESAFTAYSGVSQQAAIGSFVVPPQPFPWTPIVWGHIGGTQVSPLTNSNAQHIVNISAYGGTFTLTFGGLTTPPLPYNASPAAVQQALENLTNVGSGNVVGSLVRTMNTLLEWVNTLGGQSVATLSADATQLTPKGVATAVIHVVDSGGNLINQITNMLTGDPFMVGAQVLLGDPTQGIQVARGMGTTLGHVNIFPHYSSSANNQNKRNQAIRPGTGYAVVRANHTNPAEGTVYVNLWNDGQLGVYDFSPTNAQLFLMVKPMGPIAKPVQAAGYPTLTGEGFLSATVTRAVATANVAAQFSGGGTLSATAT
jgi:hypothetical protein